MRLKLFVVIITLLPIFLYAQVDLKKINLSENVQDSLIGTSIILKNNEIIFQKIYNAKLTKEQLLEKLKIHLPTIKNFQLAESTNQTDNQLTGKFTDYIVNYRKYGGSLFSTWIILNRTLTANVVIQIKDNKYRVTVSNMLFNAPKFKNVNTTDFLLDDGLSTSKRTKITENSVITKSVGYFNIELIDLFDINKKGKIDDF